MLRQNSFGYYECDLTEDLTKKLKLTGSYQYVYIFCFEEPTEDEQKLSTGPFEVAVLRIPGATVGTMYVRKIDGDICPWRIDFFEDSLRMFYDGDLEELKEYCNRYIDCPL